MLKEHLIQTFNPNELEMDLFNGGVHLPSFIAPAHHIFHINRIEDYIRLVKFPMKSDLIPRRITLFNFFFMTNGRSIRSKGLNKYEFGANTFFFIPAYEITTHEVISSDAEGFYCHFSLDLLTSDYRLKDLLSDFPFLNFNCYPLVSVDEAAKEALLPLLLRLEKEYKKGENCRYEVLRVYLITLFTELNQFVAPPQYKASNAASILTEQYKNALSQHIYQKQKITDYAEILNVTPNHLNKCVKSALGKSAHDLLSEMLILEAKVLLKQTNMTISEIAYKIGRNEISDFARFFKAQTGMKPTDYRNVK
jgi:AraC family transcriptional regulator, transcriptional activator of pobA